eukprot:CAMPEP_0113571294 /NCGR_PEP_ID=MMETSP0015_2-20120614/25474_1 /TAXON_ID=2838 /ORGANISM="Odontella" /LENGTH=169 /DNA_ID=CAMNT_0000474229 /DNA_START=289 /DNA_END=798 /DNA_ORIENTATION=+ /assembly_acc=CAM_ASM_000160
MIARAEEYTGESELPDDNNLSSEAYTNLLHADLVGLISTFLDLSDARSLIFSLGRSDIAAPIKRFYLWRNLKFMAGVLAQDDECRLINIRAWLEVNNNWVNGQDRLLSSVRARSRSSEFRDLFDNIFDIVLEADDQKPAKKRDTRTTGGWRSFYSSFSSQLLPNLSLSW